MFAQAIRRGNVSLRHRSRRPYRRRPMDTLQEVGRVRAASSDTSNPNPEELHELLARVQRIGVIGLSRNLEKAARRVPSYLAAKGYDIVPINPNAERIFGKTAFDTLTDVPGELDLGIIFRPSETAGPFVEEAARRPERPGIWLQEGILAPHEAGAARAEGLTVVQDLCIFKVHRALFG